MSIKGKYIKSKETKLEYSVEMLVSNRIVFRNILPLTETYSFIHPSDLEKVINALTEIKKQVEKVDK